MQLLSPTGRVSRAQCDTWPVLPPWTAQRHGALTGRPLDSAARDTRLLASQRPQKPKLTPENTRHTSTNRKMAVHSGALRALLPVYGAEGKALRHIHSCENNSSLHQNKSVPLSHSLRFVHPGEVRGDKVLDHKRTERNKHLQARAQNVTKLYVKCHRCARKDRTRTYRYSHGESYRVDSGSLQSLGEDGVGEGTDQAEPVDLHRQITEKERKSLKRETSMTNTTAVATGRNRGSLQSKCSERMPLVPDHDACVGGAPRTWFVCSSSSVPHKFFNRFSVFSTVLPFSFLANFLIGQFRLAFFLGWCQKGVRDAGS